MAAFELHNLTLGYAGQPAVQNLNGCFESGSLTAIVGPNGSGKSTLLKGLAGLLKPLNGEIIRSGSGPFEVAYLPQVSELDLSFPATVHDLVAMGFGAGVDCSVPIPMRIKVPWPHLWLRLACRALRTDNLARCQVANCSALFSPG